MIKIEIKKLLRSPLTSLFTLAILAIVIVDAFATRKNFLPTPYTELKYLLASNNEGHTALITLTWALPIYYFVLISEGYLREHRRHLVPLELSRSTRQKYLRAKLLVGPGVVSAIYLFALLVNMLIVSVIAINDSGTVDISMLEVFPSWLGLSNWVYDHRLMTYCLYLIMLLLIVFTLGVLIETIVIFRPDRRIAYPALLVYWSFFLSLNFSINLSIQPFTEYGLSYALISLLVFLIPSWVIITLGWRRLINRDYV
ncbi:hypothetical protein ACFQHW_02220 [Lapidilactobacillus achengensis]|uniref:ABC transporter permease n=1 Tax=Lapidilactobacillus achengensis TaxID=2486000 RepID=A0ABW1UNI2_9LACO|nr:hypothetical protein [Lapidilactobacillus achengensis]